MTILVTGAAGFIGKNFVIENYKSADFICVDKLSYAADISFLNFAKKQNIPFYSADINNTEFIVETVAKHKIKLIVNFAAETHVDNSINDIQPFVSSNINGTISILEVLKKTKVKLLHISTDEVYGPATNKAFVEEDRLNPQNPYSATKASSEMLINTYKNTFNVQSWIVRPTNNFGNGQNFEKFIPKYIACLQNNESFPIYGDGSQIREWLYVKDTANLLFEIVNKILRDEEIPHVLNLGSKKSSKTNIEVCKQIFECFKPNSSSEEFKKTIKFVTDRPGHDKKYAVNCNKLFNLFPHFKFWNFEEAISKTLYESLH